MTKTAVFMAAILCFGAHAGFSQDESLRIGPGDQIGIQVLEAQELTQHPRVTDNGTVPLIVGGDVKVAGLTPADAGNAIAKILVSGQYMLHPHVSVVVEQYATQNVTVIGQVKSPSAYPIGTPRPVLAVLALAGGVTDMADRRIEIERHGSKERVEYFLSNDSATALDKSPEVYPGDTIVVPKIDVVYVLGDVSRPGGYPMATNNGQLSLLQAVGLAGSRLPHAKADSTRLIRKQPDGTYVEQKIAMSKLENGDMADVALRPDDIVYIPFSFLKNMGTNLAGLVSATGSAAIVHY